MKPTSLETFPALEPEAFFTIKEAANRLNLKYWALLRAVNSGLIPSYTLVNSRLLVRLSEIEQAIAASASKESDSDDATRPVVSAIGPTDTSHAHYNRRLESPGNTRDGEAKQ